MSYSMNSASILRYNFPSPVCALYVAPPLLLVFATRSTGVPSSRFNSTLNAPVPTLGLFVLHVHTIRHVPAALKLGVCWLSCPMKCCMVTQALGPCAVAVARAACVSAWLGARLLAILRSLAPAAKPSAKTIAHPLQTLTRAAQPTAMRAARDACCHRCAMRCHPFVPSAVLFLSECST